MQKTLVQYLSQEDPLEKDMATHSSILAWEIPWTEEPSGVQSMGSQRVGHNLVTEHACIYLSIYSSISHLSIYVSFYLSENEMHRKGDRDRVSEREKSISQFCRPHEYLARMVI